MKGISIGRIVVAGALVAALPFAVAQGNRHDAVHYSWGQSDEKPRFEDPNAIYLWHQGRTFYIAVGGEQRGDIFVRADVQRGSIDNVTHRRENEWKKGAIRKYDEHRWERNTDSEGVRRQGPDVIEYATRSGGWDFVRFDVRRGESVRFDFDSARNSRNHRTIYVGGENDRTTRSEAVIIDFKH